MAHSAPQRILNTALKRQFPNFLLFFDYSFLGVILNAVQVFRLIRLSRSPHMKSPNILLSIVAAVAMTFGLSTSSVQGGAGGTCASDINGDGRIDGADLAQLLADWGQCPAVVPG